MKLTASILAVTLLAAIGLPALADATPLSAATGKVASVDAAAKTFVVKVDDRRGEPRDMTFVLEDTSKIVKDGAAIPATQLAPGDSVTVTYRSEGEKNVVVNVGVGSKP